jgi:hypothetical protein
MPCGQYCYGFNWDCRAGRLNKLNVQVKPNMTRDYGSQSARERLLRRRTSANVRIPPKDCFNYKREECNPYIAYGPLFGLRKAPRHSCCTGSDPVYPAKWYRSNGGSGSDVVYWKRVHGGPIPLMSSCLDDTGAPASARCNPSMKAQCAFAPPCTGSNLNPNKPLPAGCKQKCAGFPGAPRVSKRIWGGMFRGGPVPPPSMRVYG